MARYDSIIIGAGHNGLVCAAYLAKAGQKVLILEAADNAGGLAASREFHPGFRAAPAHSLGHFSARVARDLGIDGQLKAGGQLGLVGLAADGEHVHLDSDGVHGVSNDDQRAFDNYRAALRTFADSLDPFWHKIMPRIAPGSVGDMLTFAQLGWNLKRLGKDDMLEFFRVASLPMRDLMDEYFDSDLMKATLSWDGLIGSRMAPRSPNSSVLALLYRLSENDTETHVIPKGGIGGLIDGLIAAATGAGAEMRLGTAVDRVVIDGDETGQRATGVVLANGEKIESERVISATDPRRTFVELVGVEHLDIGFTNRIARLRCDGLVGKLHLALDHLPAFTGIERPDQRMLTAATMDEIEFCYDPTKYGELPDRPVLEVVVPTLHDTSLAPDGKHVLSAHVMYLPHRLKGGWDDVARQRVTDQCLDVLETFSPGIRENVLASRLLSPADLERDYRVTGGHWHHTEFAMDQMLMMRPTYEAGQYATPVPQLYLCSAGCHPGGDVTGIAGHNAAKAVLA
ncbi:MAG: NAD(P)/FAD-dependent oxidoreductase [Pseudomonadota bacterium]